MTKPPILPADTACNPSILESAAGLKIGPALDSLTVLPDSDFHPVRSCQMPAPSKAENSSQNLVPRAPRKFLMFDNSLHHGARFFVFPELSESSLRTAKCAMPKSVCNQPAVGEISQDAVQLSFVTKQLVESPKETDKSISQAIALLQQMRHSRLQDIFGDVLQHPVVNAREERQNCSSQGSRVSDVASEGCFQEDSGDIDALLSLDGNYSDDDGDVDEDEDEDEVTSCLHPLTEDFSLDVNQVQNAIPSKRKWHYGVDGIEEQISIGLLPENGVLHHPLKTSKKQKMEVIEDSPRRVADAVTVLDGVIEYVKLLQMKVADLEASKHANF